jgi:hypothetical protein
VSSSICSVPSADWVSVSFPVNLAPLVLDELRHVVSDISGVSAMSTGNGWAFPSGGLIQLRSRSLSPVAVISASGAALAALRSVGAYAGYLRVLSSDVHRLTRLDVALDLLVDAPSVLEALYSRAKSGGVSLTRKALDPHRHVSRWQSPDSAGLDTGTVYLGGKTSEVRSRVYDKRLERIARGLPDPGSWLRAELTVTSAMGISLKDAWEPAPVFWHFMARALEGIVTRPSDVPAWVPAGDSVGFVLPPRPVLDPMQRLERRLERSSELRDLCELARSIRSGAVLVYRRLRQLGLSSPSTLGFVPGFLAVAANDG